MTSFRPRGPVSHLVDRAFARAAIRSGLQRNDPQLVKAGRALLRQSFLAGTEASSIAPSQLMTDALSERMAQLLSQSPNPRHEMAQIENLLEREGYWIDTKAKSPAQFCWDIFEGIPELARAAERIGLDPASAESAEDLMLRLLPSDGHLD